MDLIMFFFYEAAQTRVEIPKKYAQVNWTILFVHISFLIILVY